MAGDPNNAAVWAEADVYIANDLEATKPTGGAAFGAGWDLVGLLNGEDGFAETPEFESDDFYAWGGILIATTRRNYKLTKQFTALEDNETVLGLSYDTTGMSFNPDGTYSGDLAQPDLFRRFLIGFEVRTGETIKRLISKNYAQIDEFGEVTESEDDLQSRQYTVAIYPDEEGVLFDTYKGPAESGSS